MHPIAFKIGTVTIYWYGIMAAIGFVSALLMLSLNRKHADMTNDQISDIALYGMLGGILGARTFYVIQFWEQFKYNLIEIVRIDHGGLVFYGGLICSTIVIMGFCLIKKIRILNVLDIFAPALCIGHAFGRIGCFINGCCFGKPSDFFLAVKYPEGSVPCKAYPEMSLHPVQLYEAFSNVILAVIFYFLIKKLKPGQTASIYLVTYGILRFCLELFRGDHKNFIFGIFTPAQFIGILIVIMGICLYAYSSRKSAGTEK